MRLKCPNLCTQPSADSGLSVKKGYYFRKSDSRWITRFQCLACKKHFSSATCSPCYRQKKRRLNSKIKELLCSGVSQRRIAKLLKAHRITVARKLAFLSQQAKLQHDLFLKRFIKKPLCKLQFDELETFEHTKCKPLSIALFVSDQENQKRVILGARTSSMPAKGLLAKLAIKKYGFRPDFRRKGIEDLFDKTQTFIGKQPQITSDENPRYPGLIRKFWSQARHVRVKGKRGCIVGQGELKKIGFDPLFSFNHTAAMFRANINRLIRKTWCTTKKMEALEQHIWVYINYHNQKLLRLEA